MRRRLDFEPKSFFQGREMPRLMTLLIMLGVIGMLILRASDPHTWTLFAALDQENPTVVADLVKENQPAQPAVAAPDVPPPDAETPAVLKPAAATSSDALQPASENSPTTDEPPLVPPPPVDPPTAPSANEPFDPTAQPAAGNSFDTKAAPQFADDELPAKRPDQDDEERGALAEEFEAVTDKEYLHQEEMPAYYRLLRWSQGQTLDEMRKQAKKNPRFGDIFERPEAYRGKLLDIRLHVLQNILHDDLEEDNSAGVERLWQLTGWNDDSMPYSYMCITDELPEKMPAGGQITEDGRFVGYFLKLMAYEDREGKKRAMPVLIGRFDWEKPLAQRSDPEVQVRQWTWTMLGGAALGVLVLVRWGLRLMSGKRVPSPASVRAAQIARLRRPVKDDPEEEVDLETWLDRNEAPESDAAINPPEDDDLEESDEDERYR